MSSSTNPATTIDYLPPEMINEVFKHLHPSDLAACSMVNKLWNSIYAGFRVHRLVVYVDDYYSEFHKWSYPDRHVEVNEVCYFDAFDRLTEKPLLSNLKYLSLSGIHPKFDPSVLNKFSQLEHLEYLLQASFSNKKANWNLPKLKVLVIPKLIFEYLQAPYSLTIDCPELNVLVYSELSNEEPLEVKHPETIKTLQTDMVGLKLSRFKNLECLKTRELNAICKATLLSLPRLKELHYIAGAQELWNRCRDAVGTLERVKETLKVFLDDLRVLKGPAFKFTFAGFQLTKTTLKQIDFCMQVITKDGRENERVCNEQVYIKNYQFVNPGALYFIDYVTFNTFLDACSRYNVHGELPSELPGCLVKKYNQIERVNARPVQDEAQFLRFLKSLNWLESLCLYGPGVAQFSQEFYNQLPASACSLTRLSVDGYEDSETDREKEFELNFDFIDGLPSLRDLVITKHVSLESLVSLIRRMRKFKKKGYFLFKLKGRRLTVSKNIQSSKLWEIIDFSPFQTVFKSENPDEFLNYFEGLRSGN